jgi:BirA family biotin operon repressor/biotin-[acetyl-CoA-carboxylase] ligase
MNAERIMQLARCGVAVEVVAQTGSTNADLLARASRLAAPLLLAAEHQTAGRGRAGRSWLSAPGDSLTFSLAWRFAGGLPQMTGLPLAVGVALAETLAALGQQVGLKWPNDVLKDGDKLAGILVEAQPAPDGAAWAVIGIGMNLAMPAELEQQIGRAVAAVPWLARMDRDALMATLLDGLAGALAAFAAEGFAPFAPRWNLLHAYANQPVVIVDRGTTLHEGLAAGVDATGRLLLDTAQGRVAIVAGDVSLRPKE